MLIIGVVILFLVFRSIYWHKRWNFLEDKAEKIGGIILIGIGLKILIEHLFFL